MKTIIDTQKVKIYINTQNISALKAKKENGYYYNIDVFLKNGNIINFKCDEEQIDEIVKKLKD